MGASQRRKGKTGEREIANEIRAALDIDVHRGWQARAGTDACDVEGVPDCWVECKRGKKPNPRAALQQATEDSDGRIPIAVIRDDGEDAFAVLSLDALLALIDASRSAPNYPALSDRFKRIRNARIEREAAERKTKNGRARESRGAA